jgi:hypothetical protein
MRRSGKGSGGGAGMNKNVRPPVRYGERSREIRHEGVAQIGTARGNHSTDAQSKVLRRDQEPVRGELRPSGGPGGVELGNSVARNVGAGGPGTGRTVMRSGSQHSLPGAKANPGGRDILSEFGRESAAVTDRSGKR